MLYSTEDVNYQKWGMILHR